MPRLFTGIEIPAAVAERLAMLRGGLSGARWVPPENYHVTLRFIGDVDNRTADTVAELLAEVRRPAFSVGFDGLAHFGGRRPHAVIAAMRPDPALVALQGDHERAIQRAGLPPEGRRFSPHVTLARVKGASANSVAGYIQSRGGLVGEAFGVGRFVLFSSRPVQGGGPYVIEGAYDLDRAERTKGEDPWPTG